MGEPFTHLHVHTEYSMLDGASRLPELVAKAMSDGQPALGITDHGNMYGVLDFYRECNQQGIKPVIGTEAYMAHEHRSERPARRGRMDDSGGDVEGGRKLYYHLTLLAETDEGYRNLLQLASSAFLEGYYVKPRMDWEMLSRHAGGLIATTGCLGGHVLQALLRDDTGAATEAATRLQDIFGRDNLFVELQDHGLPEQRRTNPKLLELAKRIGAPLLATNDSHYTHREDHEAHDALLCVQTNDSLSNPNRFRFEGHEHYLKSASEMRYTFRDVPEACDNTLWIAERADVTIEFGTPTLPDFPLPEGVVDNASYLEQLTWAGARERWGDELPQPVVERVAYELKVINDMGYSAYFLIVWDLIRYARERGIRVGPGRGSAAGCAVAYALRITDLDPIHYDLLFERFLNPSRVSMPDIDMDFDSRYRDELINYAARTYGRDHVAQIITFSTIKARQAVRDSARVLGFPYGLGDRVAKAMPPLVMGRDTPLRYCLEEDENYRDGYKAAAELRAMCDADPDVKKVVEVARGLEGMRRSDGIHAAAVVITRDPLTTYLPVQRKPEPGQDPANAPLVTQYEMHGVEELGLLKMDFLGLRNLDVITDTEAMIRAKRDSDFDIDSVPLDDAKVFELLSRGDGIGVFQLEGGPMRALMRSLAPSSFDDVAALVALYRPGPMAANMHNDYADRKNGRKKVVLLHADLEEPLGDTYGLMIYQESMMRVAQKCAGYTLAEADNLRKACLPAGTRVLTKSRGYVPIERLMRMSDRRVQTIDEVSATSRFESVADVWPVGRKPVLRLRTGTGYSIEATADHPFLVGDEWRPLGEIQPGDLVAVARRIRTDGGGRITMAEVELAALLISEGYTPDVRHFPARHGHFANTDPELLDAFRNAYESRFGRPHTREAMTGSVTQLRLLRNELLELEPVLGVLGLSGDKAIPWRLVNAPSRKVERFIGLYFCADGWADGSGAHFASKSQSVVQGLKRMLLRFGITSNVCSGEIAGYGQHWTLHVADKGQAKAFAQLVEPHLTATKRAKVERWLVEWGSTVGASATGIGIPARFVAEEAIRRQAVTGRSRRSLGIDTGGYASSRVLHRDTLAGLLYSERLEDLRTGDLVWDTVSGVEAAGDADCYDFEMSNAERPYAVVEDFLVHNCGKKNRDLIAKERAKFVAGCERTGYGTVLGTRLFDIIEPFADYAFNKSHAFGYGLVAYQTAYLKAHYPVEYLACLLTSVRTNLDRAAVYLADARGLGIKVLTPDVNRSRTEFVALAPDEVPADVELPKASPGAITFGLAAVRHVGEGVVGQLLEERDANGPFVDFYDFVERVPEQVLNRKVVESLIKAGAFDSFGHPRMGLLTVFEQIVDAIVARRRERQQGVMNLFDAFDAGGSDDVLGYTDLVRIPDVEFDKTDRLRAEKEMLGLYVSDHPLMGIEAALRRRAPTVIAGIAEMDDRAQVVVGGVITGFERRYTRRGDLMASFILEDLESSIEVTVFPRTLAEEGHKFADDAIVIVKGRVDRRDENRVSVNCQTVEVLTGLEQTATCVRVRLGARKLSQGLIAELKRIIAEHRGESEVLVELGDGRLLRLGGSYCVDVNRAAGELRTLFGHDAVAL